MAGALKRFPEERFQSARLFLEALNTLGKELSFSTDETKFADTLSELIYLLI